MTSKPKVSLIMPNYNYAQYLEAALTSVVNQTYTNFELILIDDASTDSSLEVIEPFLAKHSFIHLICHKKNQGMFKSCQEGLEKAQGQYVTFTSSDDLLLPSFLEKKVTVLDRYPDVGLCFSRASYFNSDEPVKLYTPILQTTYPEMKLSRKALIHQMKQYRMWIPGNTVLSRKSLFKKYGGFDSNYYSLTDWFLWLKIAFLHGAYFLPETLAIQRNHNNSMSQTESLTTKQITWSNLIKVLSLKENKVLKKAFIRSHIFNSQGYPFFDYILKRPKYWLFFKQYVYKHFYPRWKKERQPKSSNPLSNQSPKFVIAEMKTVVSAQVFQSLTKARIDAFKP